MQSHELLIGRVLLSFIRTRFSCNCVAALVCAYRKETACAQWCHCGFVLREGVDELGKCVIVGEVSCSFSILGLQDFLLDVAIDGAVQCRDLEVRADNI